MNIAKIVREAREQSRLTTLDFATGIFDEFIQLHGDRSFRDDGAVVGGIGWIGDQAVTVVGIQKGKSLQDNLKRNFGQPHPEGYRKALRLMKQAEKFDRPVVTFINTAGAYPGVGAEERGQGEAIARNLMEMSDLKVPIIAIIIGEGGSGGALALAVADRVWMLENSIYAILSPEGYRKALRLMKQAEKFGRPVVTFINTAGAYPGVGAEERGQGEAIARNLMEMSDLKVPIIAIIIGEGGSGGALALAVADRVWMLENSIYAILSPEGFASILWKDGSRAMEAAELMKITSHELLEMDVVDKVISEAGLSSKELIKSVKKELQAELARLSQKPLSELLEERYTI